MKGKKKTQAEIDQIKIALRKSLNEYRAKGKAYITADGKDFASIREAIDHSNIGDIIEGRVYYKNQPKVTYTVIFHEEAQLKTYIINR